MNTVFSTMCQSYALASMGCMDSCSEKGGHYRVGLGWMWVVKSSKRVGDGLGGMELGRGNLCMATEDRHLGISRTSPSLCHKCGLELIMLTRVCNMYICAFIYVCVYKVPAANDPPSGPLWGPEVSHIVLLFFLYYNCNFRPDVRCSFLEWGRCRSQKYTEPPWVRCSIVARERRPWRTLPKGLCVW